MRKMWVTTRSILLVRMRTFTYIYLWNELFMRLPRRIYYILRLSRCVRLIKYWLCSQHSRARWINRKKNVCLILDFGACGRGWFLQKFFLKHWFTICLSIPEFYIRENKGKKYLFTRSYIQRYVGEVSDWKLFRAHNVCKYVALRNKSKLLRVVYTLNNVCVCVCVRVAILVARWVYVSECAHKIACVPGWVERSILLNLYIPHWCIVYVL